MLEGKGLEVIDLGTDVPPETFIETAKNENCQVICLSALLTTTMTEMEEVVKAAEAAGIRDQVENHDRRRAGDRIHFANRSAPTHTRPMPPARRKLPSGYALLQK